MLRWFLAVAHRFGVAVFLLPLLGAGLSHAEMIVNGVALDPQGKPVVHALVKIQSAGVSAETTTDNSGTFSFASIRAGVAQITGASTQFETISRSVRINESGPTLITLQFDHFAVRKDRLTVTSDVPAGDIQQPDPAQRVLVHEDLLDANPGRPGAPVSLPGVPIETASGGIKAPQYFAPGVAGDHGEPIAQFLLVGTFLLPNNLSANAHGNGYADPNIMAPAIIESVQTDGGAFNVREGNHSVNLAAAYVLRPELRPFATLTADYRDIDLSTGWKWLGLQASFGNGFLDRLEHRQQYKVNALKNWELGSHKLSTLFLGYYGQSKIPGLVPLAVSNLHDTIDNRQRDQTHTGLIAANDVWHLDRSTELQLSGFFRTYNLALYSNFGDGLIRQSEFRTVTGGDATWIRRYGRKFSVMGGMTYLREAPRRIDLDHYVSVEQSHYGPFERISANNLTLNLLTPFFAVEGEVFSWLRYNLGWRRDQIHFQNDDLLTPVNSFSRWTGINNPKATLSIVPPDSSWLPAVAFSYGQAFFTNDPRIGTGNQQGSLVSRAHAYQLVVSRTVLKTDLRVVLGHVTQESSLAKIDADTGLQEDEGASRNRYVTVSARHYFGAGLLQAAVSKADARDLLDGTPVPEAPRLIVDVLGTWERLPFGLHARGEYETVERKPLGDGFVSVPVREFRSALVRSFRQDKIQVGIHFQIARGFTGQTTEVLGLPGEGEPFERVTGVYVPSYATLSISYHLSRR